MGTNQHCIFLQLPTDTYLRRLPSTPIPSVFAVGLVIACANPCAICLLCTVCRKCDPARTVDYTTAAKSPELDVDFPDRLSGDDAFSSDDESGEFVDGVSKRLDARRRACHRRLCKLIFSTTWCLSLQVIAFSALAAFFVFPAAGMTNDFCGVASIVTSDISQLGLLPEQAEAGVGACFGNGSLLSALGELILFTVTSCANPSQPFDLLPLTSLWSRDLSLKVSERASILRRKSTASPTRWTLRISQRSLRRP